MRTYEALSLVARKYYPKENNYCAVIAVSVVADVSYGKARSYLFKEGRKDGKGTTPLWTYNALEKLGYIKTDYNGRYPKTLATAVRVLPKRGTFTVHTLGHISVVKDGVLQDWAASTGSRKRVLIIKEIKPKGISENEKI
tara:strand:+ start:346 stop:765 length:420 start_codon:yes stop_codon:yes gene_type:complete